MGTFLLLLVLFFVVIPLFRIGGAIWRARRQYKDFQNQFRQAFGGEAPGAADSRKRRADNSSAQGKGGRRSGKKKIDPTMGEYVEFQEIRTTATSTESTGDGARRTTSSSFRVESQIEDVEWEDVK